MTDQTQPDWYQYTGPHDPATLHCYAHHHVTPPSLGNDTLDALVYALEGHLPLTANTYWLDRLSYLRNEQEGAVIHALRCLVKDQPQHLFKLGLKFDIAGMLRFLDRGNPNLKPLLEILDPNGEWSE